MVKNSLLWLKRNKILYKNMEINQTNLDQLPEDEVPVEISSNLGLK